MESTVLTASTSLTPEAADDDGVRERFRAYRDVLDPATSWASTPTRTFSLSVANSVSPSRGVTRVDALARRSRRRRRELPGRALHRGRDLQGWTHRCDLFALQDAADDLVRPLWTGRFRSTGRR